MARGWTADQVLQLAPDPASAKAGQGLAGVRHWVSSATDQAVLWGECQGSGSKPYQVRVDLEEPAFKCSCPSRKFPCKHALGLMLLFAGGSMVTAAMPPWVAEWVASRTERQQSKSSKADASAPPLDPQAQAKRQEKRLDRIADGLATLDVWINDLIRNGLASLPGKGYRFYDEVARRMVDAQAPGVARRVTELGAIAASGAGWETRFLERAANLHLLIRAFDRRDQLPELTRDDVLASVGIPQDAEAVLALPPVRDTWHIVAREVETENRLRVQKTWLHGQTTARTALVLQFAHGTALPDASLAPGHAFDGEVCYFPGHSQRAVVKHREPLRPLTKFAGYADHAAACEAFGALLAAQPWTQETVLPIRSMIPTRVDDRWFLSDQAGTTLPAMTDDRRGWTLAALSGGRPIDLVAGFDGDRYRPLAALDATENEPQYVPLI